LRFNPVCVSVVRCDGYLILRKIVKICHQRSDIKAEMHQIRLDWGSGSLQHSTEPLLDFRGPTSKGGGKGKQGDLLLRKGEWGWMGRRGRRRSEERGKGKGRREGKWRPP